MPVTVWVRDPNLGFGEGKQAKGICMYTVHADFPFQEKKEYGQKLNFVDLDWKMAIGRWKSMMELSFRWTWAQGFISQSL